MRYVVLMLAMVLAVLWGPRPGCIAARAQTSAAFALARRQPPPPPPAPAPPPSPPSSPPSSGDTITMRNASGVAVSNYPFQFGRPFVEGVIANEPQVLVNGAPLATQADVKNRYPDGSVEYAVIAVVIPSLPASGIATLSFQNQTAGNNTPLTRAQMLDPSYNFDAVMSLTPNGGVTQSVDARTMLSNGDYKLWTSGPVAQTILLGDDSAARKYDIGFGDGYHPFRPRFEATFWPATHQVFVRAIGENGLSTELEDLAYKLTLTGANSIVYTADLSGDQPTYPKEHWARTRWTRTFWLGGTPQPAIDIDNNLAYLEATRFLPNFDTSIQVPAATVTSYADNNWLNYPHDLYDGLWDNGSYWQNDMGTGGQWPHIGPYPDWTVLWLYTGDWRLRQMALGMADLAGAFPGDFRESDPTRRLLRSDPAGLDPSTGLGHVVSVTDRPTLYAPNLTYSGTTAHDKVTIVGPINLNQPWSIDGAHQPAAFYPQYILTGDPWYLDMMYAWAGFSPFLMNGADIDEPYGRGPTGQEGAILDQLRGAGWLARNRAEAAFAAPDGAPEKTYFTYLMNDALARWEGGFQIAGTAYDGTAEKVWGQQMGDAYTYNPGNSASGQAPPLHNWESDSNASTPGDCETCTSNANAGVFVPGAVGSFTSPWMQWYDFYSFGRVAELGFAATPLNKWTGDYLLGMINNSGIPQLVAQYQIPVEKTGGGFFPTWAATIAALQPAFLNGNESDGGLPAYFAANLFNQGREVWATPGLAMLVDEGAAGAAQAWQWWTTNVYAIVNSPAAAGGSAFDLVPTWAIVPRTDTNTLPPQPTATPPS